MAKWLLQINAYDDEDKDGLRWLRKKLNPEKRLVVGDSAARYSKGNYTYWRNVYLKDKPSATKPGKAIKLGSLTALSRSGTLPKTLEELAGA